MLPCYVEQILREPRIRDVIALSRRADVLPARHRHSRGDGPPQGI